MPPCSECAGEHKRSIHHGAVMRQAVPPQKCVNSSSGRIHGVLRHVKNNVMGFAGTPAASEDDASEGENDERDVRRPTGTAFSCP